MFNREYTYKQVVATLHGCRVDLSDEKFFLELTLRAIRNAGMRLAKTKSRNPLSYQIEDDIMGGGVSVNALITTSHLTVHTANRHGAVEFDCATCGRDSEPWLALETFKRALRPLYTRVRYECGSRAEHTPSSREVYPTIKSSEPIVKSRRTVSF
jgi:S-adenosylmethionine/arginine decarboxylase-like enzyme